MTDKPKPNLPAARRRLHTAVTALIAPTEIYRSQLLTAPSPYEQLCEAVSGTNQRPGGRGASKSRPPLWIDAAALLHEIDFDVSIWPCGNHGTTPQRLTALTHKKWTIEDTKRVFQLATIIQDWTEEITRLLTGQHTRHLQAAACPACGATTHRHIDSGGDLIRTPALQITAAGCTCQVCKHTWAPTQYLLLSEVLGCQKPAGILD